MRLFGTTDLSIKIESLKSGHLHKSYAQTCNVQDMGELTTSSFKVSIKNVDNLLKYCIILENYVYALMVWLRITNFVVFL